MPRSSGTMVLVAGNPVISGSAVSSVVQNNTMNDVANEITNSIPRDGSAPPTANFPLGNFKITGSGAATLATDLPQYQQIQSGATNYLTSVSGTNTIIATLTTPTLTSYVTGQHYTFIATGTNTAATTVNINAIGAKTIQKNGVALGTGDITSGQTYELIYDGTNMQLFGASVTSTQLQNQLQNQTAIAFTTGGTSAAFTLTPTPAITANAANQLFFVKFNAAPTGSPTLAVSGQAALNLRYYNAAGTKQFITAAQVPINWQSPVFNDGTDWVVENIILPIAVAADVNARTSGTLVVTPLALQGLLVLATVVNSTSGTFIDFTGIPTWAKRITIMLNGVSTNGTAQVMVQIGSGSIDNSASYACNTATTNTTTIANTAFPAAIGLEAFGGAAFARHGALTLSLQTGNLWVASGNIAYSNTPQISMAAGAKVLSGALDRIRLTTNGGVDTFDAGTVNIMWE